MFVWFLQEEIVFDSGADVSALPLRFSDVGVPGSPNPNLYVDAQGNPINVKILSFHL